VSDAYKALFKTAGEIGSKPYTPYTGGYTPDQRQAFGNIRNLRGSQDQTFANANAAYQRASVPTYSSVSNYMSPYIDNVVNAAIANMNEQNGQQQQQVIGNAITKGAWGGDRVGVAQAELARQQKLANNDTIANLYKDAFSQALGAAQNQQQVDLGTASGLTGLGQTAMGTNLNQTAAQLGAGTQQQQFDYAQYLNKQGYPYQQASWLSGILGNIGPNAGGSTVQLTPNGNLLTQLLGAGLSIAGLFKDGGVVPRSGYAGGGGVTPVNPWATLPMNGSPYSVSGDSQWGGYIPTDDGGGSRANFPEISQNKPDDPFDLSSPSDAMRAGATNISNWFSGRADGGVIPHMADGGLPTGYADILGGVVKGPNGTIISAPRYSPGYSPSEYAGIYARPSQAPVARSVKTVPVRAASPAYASIPANAGVYGGPGSRPAGMPAVARLAADISPYAPANYGYISSDGDAWASTRGISPAPEAQPGVVTGGRGPLVAAGVANPSPVASYAPTNGTNTNIFTARAAQGHPLSRLFGSGDYVVGGPLTRLFNWLGNSTAATPAAPRSFTPPAASVPNRSRPITYDMRLANPPAGTRYTAGGQDMAFMPTSVQTSSRWNTGYASGGVVPHMANGGFPDTSGVNINDMFPSINPWVTQPEMTPEAAQLALAAAIPVASKTAADQAASRAAAVQPTSAAIGTGMGDGDYTPVAPPDMGGPQVNAFADVVPANDGGGGVLGAAHDYGQQGGVTPFARGDQFITNPDPRYSQNIGDAFKSLVSGGGLNLDPATRQAMLGMGFGMMASKNPSFLGGVGEGGLKGIETWAGRTNQERENAKTRADLATTAAGLPLTEAQTGFTNVNAAATRYTFRPGLQGVMVTDALNPTATQFVPWGGILPNGQVATEETINNSILFNTKVPSYSDPRGMVPEATSLVLNETAGALGGAREEAIGAASSAQVLNNVRTALDELPADGPLAQGAGFASRLGFAKSVNGALSVLGLAPQFDENAIAAGEDLKKFAFQLGGTMAQGFGGSNTAAGLITDAIADATPNADLTKEGAERIINSLEMINKRKMDYYTLMQQWQGKNGGSIMGFDEWFNRANPPELYAMAAYIPAAAFQRLIDNPKLADDFNKAYGHGRDIARYVIGRN